MAMLLVQAAMLLAGPMNYLRPYDKFAQDQQKLLEQLDRDKQAAPLQEPDNVEPPSPQEPPPPRTLAPWTDRLQPHLDRCVKFVKQAPRRAACLALLTRMLVAHVRITAEKRVALKKYLSTLPPDKPSVTIVTTAALPWKTGTAVNALLRAACERASPHELATKQTHTLQAAPHHCSSDLPCRVPLCSRGFQTWPIRAMPSHYACRGCTQRSSQPSSQEGRPLAGRQSRSSGCASGWPHATASRAALRSPGTQRATTTCVAPFCRSATRPSGWDRIAISACSKSPSTSTGTTEGATGGDASSWSSAWCTPITFPTRSSTSPRMCVQAAPRSLASSGCSTACCLQQQPGPLLAALACLYFSASISQPLLLSLYFTASISQPRLPGPKVTNESYSLANESLAQVFVVRGINNLVCRAYCDRVIKLSDCLQTLPRASVCNVHGVRAEFIAEGRRRAEETDAAPAPFTDGAYFIGKVLWAKGHRHLIDYLKEETPAAGGARTRVDIFGDGDDLVDVSAASDAEGLDLRFCGALDHADASLHGYKVFVNPSQTEVLSTTTAEALAMGKFAVIEKNPSNEFFYGFANVLTYETPEQFREALSTALASTPAPLSQAESRALSWAGGTERFLEAVDEAARLAKVPALGDGLAHCVHLLLAGWRGYFGDAIKKYVFESGPVARQRWLHKERTWRTCTDVVKVVEKSVSVSPPDKEGWIDRYQSGKASTSWTRFLPFVGSGAAKNGAEPPAAKAAA